MSPPEVDADVLVAGGGAAGLTIATRLASEGWDVVVANSGTPMTALSTGRVLFDHRDPEVRRWASLFLPSLRLQGADYALQRCPVMAMTNLGTIMEQSLMSPKFDWMVDSKEVAIMGLVGNDDLDPDLICREIARAQRGEAQPYRFLPSFPPELDEERLIEELGDAIRNRVAEGTVVVPPLPSKSPYGLLGLLRERSGREVVEAATPLSWPGRRFLSLLEDAAERAGARMLQNRRLCHVDIDGREAGSALLSSGMRKQGASFNVLVLATGNAVSGGLSVRGRDIIDPLGMFRVSPVKASGIASPRLLACLASGMDVRDGRAVTAQGMTIGNVIPIGSLLGGMSFPLGYGLGDVMMQAWKAAPLVEEAL